MLNCKLLFLNQTGQSGDILNSLNLTIHKSIHLLYGTFVALL